MVVCVVRFFASLHTFGFWWFELRVCLYRGFSVVVMCVLADSRQQVRFWVFFARRFTAHVQSHHA